MRGSRRVRVATTDSIAVKVLAPRAQALLEGRPGLSLDLMVSTENVNFARWEADVAIRLAKPAKGDFTISKLADLELYLFEPADLAADGSRLVCAYPEELDATPESNFLDQQDMLRFCRLRTKNVLVVEALLQSKKCCGILPAYAAAALLNDASLRAKRLPDLRGAWLLVQAHLRRDALFEIVVDWIRACFSFD